MTVEHMKQLEIGGHIMRITVRVLMMKEMLFHIMAIFTFVTLPPDVLDKVQSRVGVPMVHQQEVWARTTLIHLDT